MLLNNLLLYSIYSKARDTDQTSNSGKPTPTKIPRNESTAMNDNLTLSQVYSASLVAGQVVQLFITPPAGKQVLVCGGTASVLAGVYQGDQPVGANGKLRVCGVAKRGVRVLAATQHLIQVTAQTSGTFTVELRPWNFGDYFTINRFKSSC